MLAMPRCRTALIAVLYATLHAPLTLAQELPQDDAKALCDAPRLRMNVEKEPESVLSSARTRSASPSV